MTAASKDARPIYYATKFEDMHIKERRYKNVRRHVFKAAQQVERYPMYAIPVPTLLGLQKWRPHQDLLADGLLKQCTEDDDVIFVSHQWLSFKHPDPQCEQLESLKKILRRLIAGELKVESNAILQTMYGQQLTTTRDEWKRRLPGMLIWFDYTSMPQPMAASKEQASSADHRISESGVVDELVESLCGAVDSIPTFVERCSMMWILCPPCQHVDNDDLICDFASWRSRGWCRLEYAASKLARGEDMPVMVIRSTEGEPEYFNPCDTMKLAAARGAFAVDEDRAKVNSTLQAMLDAKVDHFFELGDVGLARLLLVFAPVFLSRLQDTEEADDPAEAASASSSSSSSAGTGGIDRVKERLRWRDEATEAAWMAETGWSLLTLACAFDDEIAVRALLAEPQGRAMLSGRVKPSKVNTPLRSQPFSTMFIHLGTGMSPLMAAVTFSRPSVVEALLEAGAPMPVGTKLFGDNPCQFRGFFGGKISNLKLLIRRYPELASKINQTGTSACHFACMLSVDQGQRDILKELLDHGAAATLNTHHIVLGTPMMILCGNPDADPAAAALLHEAGGSQSLQVRGRFITFARVLYAVMWVMSKLGKISGRGFMRIMASGPGKPHPKGTTAVHVAAQRGHVAMVKAVAELAEVQQVLQAKDAFGMTPLDRARHTASSYEAVLEPVLGSGGGTKKPQAGGWVQVTPPAQVAPKHINR